MKNDSLKSIIVLTCICIVISAALALTNYFTGPIIKAAENAAANEALYEVIPDAEGFEKMEGETVPATVTAIYRETSGKGFVIQLSFVGYDASKPISAAVGIDGSGNIIKAVIISCSGETPGKGDIIAADSFLAPFVGQNSNLSSVTTVSGATISTSAVINAVRDAFEAYTLYSGVGPAEKTDDDYIRDLLPTLVSGANSFTDITESGAYPDNVRNVFSISPDIGYVVVYNFGTAEESDIVLVSIDAFGNVTKAIDLEGTEVTAGEDKQSVIDGTPALFDKTIAEKYDSANQTSLSRIIASDATLTPISVNIGTVSTVIGAYKVTLADGSIQYAIVATAFGNGGVVKIGCILDENGAIVKYKTLSSTEEEEAYEYYGGVIMEGSYATRFDGLTSGTYDASVSAISGATYTSNAVHTAMTDIFAAVTAITEVTE